MSQDPSQYLDRLEPIATSLVAEHALRVDREGRFPAEALAALGEAKLLGLVSAKEVGGLGQGLARPRWSSSASRANAAPPRWWCCMHYARRRGASRSRARERARRHRRGQAPVTLAFSEAGSRSHFWAPLSTATRDGERRPPRRARRAGSPRRATPTAYVWSSKPVAAERASTLWLVPRARQPGSRRTATFDGLGLRGNDSRPGRPPTASSCPRARGSAPTAAGSTSCWSVVLPIFNVLNAACSPRPDGGRGAAHRGARGRHAAMRTTATNSRRSADGARLRRAHAHQDGPGAMPPLDTLTALETGRADAMLRVLECKAAAGEASAEVLDLAMRVCGGAAFRKDVGVERQLPRRARRDGSWRPTTDALYDFIGKAVCGCRCSEAMMPESSDVHPRRGRLRPKVVTIWDGFRAGSPSTASPSTTCSTPTTSARWRPTSPAHIHVAWNSPLAWLESERAAARSAARPRPSRCATPIATSPRVVLVRGDGP